MLTKLLIKTWPFALLTIIVVISQIIILKPHLKYGFSDVDWGYLALYKTRDHFSPSQFIKYLKTPGTQGGIYTQQIYYIGIQEDLFGLDFESFNKTTHFFKILATLACYPIFLIISGSVLVAFIATLLLAFSYSGIGTMYTVISSVDYLAIFSMGIFLTLYWYIVKNRVKSLRLLVLTLLLFMVTIFLSTKRLYQLPIFVIIIEFFLIKYQKTWQQKNIVIRRLIIMMLPLFLIFITQPKIYLDFVFSNGSELVRRILIGNWNLILTPFIVLGSFVLPHDYTRYIGTPKMDSFGSFLEFLFLGPIFIFVTSTIIIAFTIFKKPLKYIFWILSLISIFSIVLYILGTHFVDHQISIESITQALVGLYILIIAFVIFKYWTENKERLLIGLYAGPLLAIIFIFFTWIAAATSEVFSGTHRYLTIPAIPMSLFIANLFFLISYRLFTQLKNFSYLKFFAISPLILLVIFINSNAKGIQDFFNSQLKNGFGAYDKQMMRNQLLNYLNNLNSDKPSLIYFDFTDDNENGYYYDNTLLGGLGTWILWYSRINFNEDLTPSVFWNNTEILKASISEKNGVKGFLYNEKFFKLEDFYAFKLTGKKVYNIKEELLSSLGI